MTGQDLLVELKDKIRLLDEALNQFRHRGSEFAQAEHDYRVALSREIATQRTNGVPVTIINDLCKGREEVAKLRLERDLAETVYKSAGEAINSYKLQIRVIEGQISREWHS